MRGVALRTGHRAEQRQRHGLHKAVMERPQHRQALLKVATRGRRLTFLVDQRSQAKQGQSSGTLVPILPRHLQALQAPRACCCPIIVSPCNLGQEEQRDGESAGNPVPCRGRCSPAAGHTPRRSRHGRSASQGHSAPGRLSSCHLSRGRWRGLLPATDAPPPRATTHRPINVGPFSRMAWPKSARARAGVRAAAPGSASSAPSQRQPLAEVAAIPPVGPERAGQPQPLLRLLQVERPAQGLAQVLVLRFQPVQSPPAASRGTIRSACSATSR